MEALYVQLPGRESRLREASVPDIATLTAGVADAIAPFSDHPFALFGHSLGGLIAFEVARTLRQRRMPSPLRLFASACRAPHVPSPFPILHKLCEGELLRQVNARYGGSVPKEIMESAELRELLVPALRADFAALENYQYQPQPPLATPITVFGGIHDQTLTRPELDAWSHHTTNELRLRLVDGGHLYLQTARQQLLADIAEDLSCGVASTNGAGRV
jgi:surfactin synthase thioesterase subunit